MLFNSDKIQELEIIECKFYIIYNVVLITVLYLCHHFMQVRVRNQWSFEIWGFVGQDCFHSGIQSHACINLLKIWLH